MNATHTPARSSLTTFRFKLLATMMLVVSGITALGVFLAQRQLAANEERELEREFQDEVASLDRVQKMHHGVLAERCRTLALKPRIHAALEDNALDLLYPSAKDELRDVMEGKDPVTGDSGGASLHAHFYRFLDAHGALIRPPNTAEVGALRPQEEAHLSLPAAPANQQVGYLLRKTGGGAETIDEVIAAPINSTETGQPIAAIVVGFKPVELGRKSGGGMQSGIWLQGRLHLPELTGSSQAVLDRELTRTMTTANRSERSFRVAVSGAPHLLFYQPLNPHSQFPPAYEICIYPLEHLRAQQRQLRWQILGAGGLLLLGAFGASQFASTRLSAPVEKMAVESAEDRAERERAEAALERTSLELQRSARFSANTSHQLKTPVTVLRAGLEALRAHENLSAEGRDEISALIHQTFRITSIIEDLLLLSQMDAGRLQINLRTVNLTRLLDAHIDDLSALPETTNIEVKSDCPALEIEGDEHYVALILQNLLENARKYNRAGGCIRVACRAQGKWAVLTIGNTGRTIPAAAREHIFERFHRGAVGEEITGHGLGLNLARELARLHGGDLRLVGSEADWTEFEVRFLLVGQNERVSTTTSGSTHSK